MKRYSFEDIQDQVVIVTGSGRGIGRSTADLFVSHGAKVVISDVDSDVCNQAVDEIKKAGGEAIGVVADISKEEDVLRLIKSPVEKWGQIDCLVNNAGITRDGLLLRMSLEQWTSVLNVNLTGTFLCTREAVKQMRKKKKGSIINLSSVAWTGNPGQTNYSASKAGVIGFTNSMAKEFGGSGIRTNCVMPGFVETRMTDAIPSKIMEGLRGRVPSKRAAMPEEIAYPILFLASRMASYVNGAVLEVSFSGSL